MVVKEGEKAIDRISALNKQLSDINYRLSQTRLHILQELQEKKISRVFGTSLLFLWLEFCEPSVIFPVRKRHFVSCIPLLIGYPMTSCEYPPCLTWNTITRTVFSKGTPTQSDGMKGYASIVGRNERVCQHSRAEWKGTPTQSGGMKVYVNTVGRNERVRWRKMSEDPWSIVLVLVENANEIFYFHSQPWQGVSNVISLL